MQSPEAVIYKDYHETDPPHLTVDSTFSNSSPWPRRLLHISSLRSFPWRPGNSYNNRIEPDYFAITYTWGRWQINAESHPSLAPLDFGTTWPIPRVNPATFTPDQFVDFIKRLPVHGVAPNKYRAGRENNIEFVWVDVACIDQREGSREKELEIGRQAAIFRGAYRVFAWLHQYEHGGSQELYRNFQHGNRLAEECLSDINRCSPEECRIISQELDTLQPRRMKLQIRLVGKKAWGELTKRILPEPDEPSHDPELNELAAAMDRLQKTANESPLTQRSSKKRRSPGVNQKIRREVTRVRHLSELVADLKEGVHLMTEALNQFFMEPWFSSLWTLQEGYLRSDARLMARDGEPWFYTRDSGAQLYQFMDLLQEVLSSLTSSTIHGTPIIMEFRSLIEKCGVLDMRSRIPTILLKASQSRKVNPAFANDRVYAIMQVFDFKLGRAAPDCPADARYTLEELEDQLGAALLSQSPIMSQMFYHTEPASVGKGWRIGAAVNIPQLAILIHAFLTLPSATVKSRAQLSAVTTGDKTLGHFSGVICNLESLFRKWKRSDLFGNYVKIDYDAIDMPEDVQFLQDIDVLILAVCSEDHNLPKLTKRPTTMVCMLLSHSTGEYTATQWIRRGLCFWSLEDEFLSKLSLSEEERNMLHGTGTQWQPASGTFG